MRACRSFRSAALLTLAVALAAPADAQVQRYTLDPAHTFPHFAVSHLGFSFHRGRFNSTTGTVELDRNSGRGRIAVRIDANSVDTGDEALEAQLRGTNFLDTADHPTIDFTAETLDFADGRPVAAHGTLRLRGVSQPLSLSIGHFHCGVHPLTRRQTCGAEASATLRRSEFGMGKFLSMVGDEVRLTLQVEAILESAADALERPERGGR
jgi:polyisoprenoid-binding protein YceI